MGPATSPGSWEPLGLTPPGCAMPTRRGLRASSPGQANHLGGHVGDRPRSATASPPGEPGPAANGPIWAPRQHTRCIGPRWRSDLCAAPSPAAPPGASDGPLGPPRHPPRAQRGARLRPWLTHAVDGSVRGRRLPNPNTTTPSPTLGGAASLLWTPCCAARWCRCCQRPS